MQSTIAFVAAIAIISQPLLVSAASCSADYTVCQPSGATATTMPGTGPELAPLYNDLLAAIKDVPPPANKRNERIDTQLVAKRDGPAMCCNSGLNCVNLVGFDVPMCYDRFTTNFALADGASGNIVSGSYTGADKGMANLRNGSYTAAGGASGNMYAAGGAASYSPANTAAIPTPYTASGIGGAIPISALGGIATILVTVPATTVAGTTVVGTTLGATTLPGTTNPGQTAPSTVPGTTNAGSTVAGSTIVGTTIVATTIAAHTTLITTSIVGAAAATTSSKAIAPAPSVLVAPLVGLAGAAAALLL